MRRPNINLHIEELVLHGFAPNDRYAIAEAVERELSRLLAADFAGDLPHALATNSGRPRVDAGSFPLGLGAKADYVGAQIAGTVHGGLRK